MRMNETARQALDPIEFGRRSAEECADQQSNTCYESAEECVWSYWQNVRDTLVEFGMSEHESDSLQAFWKALPANLAAFR